MNPARLIQPRLNQPLGVPVVPMMMCFDVQINTMSTMDTCIFIITIFIIFIIFIIFFSVCLCLFSKSRR